jgi:hypothetical protein|tara:strand:- start:4281 stop:4415 length:135 start_codon:yes stop_codon:yes gene_type:complete
MTTIILTIVVLALVAGWYFMPMMLRDIVGWSYSSVIKAIAYFKK